MCIYLSLFVVSQHLDVCGSRAEKGEPMRKKKTTNVVNRNSAIFNFSCLVGWDMHFEMGFGSLALLDPLVPGEAKSD